MPSKEDMMKNWLDRVPSTTRDWLHLIIAAALIWLVVNALPNAAGGVMTFVGELSPFAGGIALAYVLDIPTRFYAEKLCRGKRGPAIVLAYLTFLAVVVALVCLVVPQLFQSVSTFANALPGYLENASTSLEAMMTDVNMDATVAQKISDFLENSGDMIQEFIKSMMPAVAGAAGQAAGQVLNGVVALAASIYLLAEKEPLLRACRALLRALFPPRAAASVFSVFQLANRTFSGYIGGQLLDALLVGCETFVAMLILRLNYAPMIAVLVAVTNIIPIAGPYIGAIPSALLLLLSGEPLQALIFCILILVVQQIDGNFIAPRILGGATGIAGMVIGVPVMAVFAALLKQAVGAGLTARGLDPATGGETPLPGIDQN